MGEESRMGGTPCIAPQQPVSQLCTEENQRKPNVACMRCRDQKLKCDRELPSCVRCRRQKADCKYPSPPDRRRIARKTNQAKAPTSLSHSAEYTNRSESATTVKSKKRQCVSSNTDLNSDHILRLHQRPNRELHFDSNPETDESSDLPSTEVGLLLLEVYFKRVYNATLLFHKNTTFELYRTNSLPSYLLRAIFAQAAIFLEKIDPPHKQYNKILPFHTLYEKSWSWARSASKEVLSYADEPTLVRIQTLQVLQLYYFSQNDTQRAIVHLSIAYRVSQLLGYDRLYEVVALCPSSHGQRFEQEMKRRCFWAIWCSVCIGSNQLGFSKVCETISGLQLPARFETSGSMQGVEFKLGEKMRLDWKNGLRPLSWNQETHDQSSNSLMADMVKLMGIWINVQTFISELPVLSDTQRTTQLYRLVEVFNSIHRSFGLPLTDLCALADAHNESPELFTSVCSVYYLSRILLHASMVPTLCGRPVELQESRESARKHAEIALQQATEFTELLHQFVAKNLDITRLWPFVGYGAFIAGRLFVVFKSSLQVLRSTDQSVQGPGLYFDEIKTIQNVLEVLSNYWKPLRILAIKLNKFVNDGPNSDLSPITSPIYPWDATQSSCLPEDQDDTFSRPGDLNANIPLHHFLHIQPSCKDQLEQDVDDCDKNTDSSQRALKQPSSLELTARTEADVLRPSDSECHIAVEDFLMSSDGSSLLYDTDWWNIMSTESTWDYPAVEIMSSS